MEGDMPPSETADYNNLLSDTATLSIRKLTVEVVGARNLASKDGKGISDLYCTVEFDNEQRRTTIKPRELNPIWEESFTFSFPHSTSAVTSGLQTELLEVCIFSRSRGRSVFLGRVRIPIRLHGETEGVPQSGQETLRWMPLEKRGFLAHGIALFPAKGELGLKLYYEEQQVNRRNSSLGLTPVGAEEAADGDISRAGGRAPDNQQMLAGGAVNPARPFDLVQTMDYLFVHVLRGRALLAMDPNGASDPYVQLRLGGMTVRGKTVGKDLNPEWDQVFAFANNSQVVEETGRVSRDFDSNSSILEVSVWDEDYGRRDDFMGQVVIKLRDIERRVPPEPLIEPQWYRLESRPASKIRAKGEIQLAVWMGTQADEAFASANHSDTGWLGHFRPNIYVAPKLWYLRVHVIEAQGLLPSEGRTIPEPFVRVKLGIQKLQTKVSVSKSGISKGTVSPDWREDLLFVAAEPFEEIIQFEVYDQLSPTNEDFMGKCDIPLKSVETRSDDRLVGTRWVMLEKGERRRSSGVRGRLHLRISLDGGYHVTDESTNHRSCTRPTSLEAQKTRPSIGLLELGIVSATNLVQMKTGLRSTDAYCIAKYGRQWIRTRTIADELNPKWNEQYTWHVDDPATVLTIGVFDNRHLRLAGGLGGGVSTKDALIGKVRIRLSTLENNHKYTNAHQLLTLQASGVRKMGELWLAVRVSTPSFLPVVKTYLRPPLPIMHYIRPISIEDNERLRTTAISLVGSHLARYDPPLRKEVTRAMLDTDELLWSFRRTKAHFNRIKLVLGGPLAFLRWLNDVCRWRSTPTTLFVHALYIYVVYNPSIILPSLFLYSFLLGIWRYRHRPRTPAFMDARLSGGDEPEDADDLEEELDPVQNRNGISPVNPLKSYKVIRQRYERLKAWGVKIQDILGNVASAGERLHGLLSWRDPRATGMFCTFCLIAACVCYLIPFRIIVLFLGFFIMRHPCLRNPTPPAPFNFLMRLPSLADRML